MDSRRLRRCARRRQSMGEGGKFRTFLLASLRNYATDLYRKKRLSQELNDRVEKSSDTGDPETEFDIAWAQKLLQAVLEEAGKL